MSSVEALRIVIVAPDSLALDPGDPLANSEAQRSRELRIGLLQNGCNIVAVLPADVFLPDRLAQISPDMIIVDAESQARDTLEHVVMATRDARRPIVLFTEDSDTTHVRYAIAAGVTADSITKVKAGELVNFVAQQVGGKGGGKPDMAMAGGTDPSGLPKALASVQGWVAERL